MPFRHIISTAAHDHVFDNAARNGCLVTLGGLKWISGEPWVERVLEAAGFQAAIIYWTELISPMVAIDFGDHNIATRAIEALNGSKFEGYSLTARWHKSVGNWRSCFASGC